MCIIEDDVHVRYMLSACFDQIDILQKDVLILFETFLINEKELVCLEKKKKNKPY